MDELAVVVKNVSKRFDINKSTGLNHLFTKSKNLQQSNEILALDDVSFSVNRGEILGIIGANGSGKTTLLRVIAGIYTPDYGTIKVNGKLSPLMQLGAGFRQELEAKDNIIINGMLYGIPKNEIENNVNKIIQYAELENFQNLKLRHYSSGMKMRLAFAIAMQIDPDILLADEIMAVGDKKFKEKSFETFLSLKNNKKTIIVTTHNMNILSEICDRALLIHKGKLQFLGKVDETINHYKNL